MKQLSEDRLKHIEETGNDEEKIMVATIREMNRVLIKCAEQLHEVSDGSDFECECWGVADEADAITGRKNWYEKEENS